MTLLIGQAEKLDGMIALAEDRQIFYALKGDANYERIWGGQVVGLKNARAAMTEVDEDTLEDIVEDWAWERDEVGVAVVQPFAPYLLAHMEVK